MTQRLGLHDPLLEQLVEGKKIGRPVVLELAPQFVLDYSGGLQLGPGVVG